MTDIRAANDEAVLYELYTAFSTSLEWILRRHRAGESVDFASDWVGLIASAIDGLLLWKRPKVDEQEPPLPFRDPHEIRAESFYVARSGMRGGPPLDVLLQVWFDTEDMVGGFGVPLQFRTIPPINRMPFSVWSELQDFCRKINVATLSARLVFIPAEGQFQLRGDYLRYEDFLVSSSLNFESLRQPPLPNSGRLHYSFCNDLASGWFGDPLLSGRGNSPVLDEVLQNFNVNQILRIKVRRRAT